MQFSSSTEDSSHRSSPPSSSSPGGTTYGNTQMNTSTAASPVELEYTMLTMSASAPEIMSGRMLDATSVPFSPSLDITLMQSRAIDVLPPDMSPLGESSSGTSSPTETDPQIIEALRSKDRLWVLKLGEMMESLINERRVRIELNPGTSYQRMLVHRCSAYYKLTPEADATTKNILVYYRAESRIPERRIADLVPAEESAQPAFKIMRRNVQDRRMRQNSQPGSVTGDDADLSDVEPSETSSVGGRSNATGGSKRHPTIEEREAAYNEARSRIFMDFQEKEKEKEMSANSSTFSLVSGSGSTGGGRSSLGDVDESASSVATESEWSGPVTREKRDGKRVASSSRPLRPGVPYNQASASGSSRNSRATSPSFSYPSLYDPSAGTYEPAHGPQGPPHGYIQYYYPPYPPPGAPQPYLSAYPYPYSPYGYPPPQPSPHHSDPVSPSGGEPMYPPSQSPPHMAYQPNPYLWAPSPGQQATSPSNTNQNLPGGIHQQPQSPPQQPLQPQGAMPYPGYYGPGYAPPYPMPGYYPSPGGFAPPGQQMPPPHMQGQYFPEGQHGAEMHNNGNGNGIDNMHHSRTSSRNSNNPGPTNGNNRRGPIPPRRGPWSYGPGVGVNGAIAGSIPNNDTVGPRLTNRRTSSGSQSAGNRTPGDETSSVTSSTSSSSRRTFTSTSSKHPLPARPDWAVGLKAQPTLSSTRHHDHTNPNSRTMSPARLPGHLPNHPPQYTQNHPLPHQQASQPQAGSSYSAPLQPTDFPPLSSAPEKKTPVIGGAWTNSSSVRTVLRAGPPASTNVPAPGSALVHYPNTNTPVKPNSNVGAASGNISARADEQDRSFERPPPKVNAELFNPKGARKQNAGNFDGHVADKDSSKVDGAVTTLADRMNEMSFGSCAGTDGVASHSVVSVLAEVQND
ncbi:hypothetical protein PHLCEN_2v1856 [Hermanssonia centrifuga]|uniref:SUZ domain-containing protein n=1 Tax=Hermanssonia centrifuga TaxID=98765 RepID=A0A2R6RVP9_9APHY|nr:hypothetical protein PHLCEN_2v1856 [Hermanssonia centrifuga]